MKITRDLLKRYNADESALQLLSINGLEGLEAKDIIEDQRVPLEYLHFGFKYLNLEPSEILAYNKRCKIDEVSKCIWESNDIKGCNFIIGSEQIERSNHVSYSSQVSDSNEIHGCNKIQCSNYVTDSSVIKYSDRILASRDVEDSHDIIKSEYIAWSSYVIISIDLYECNFIYVSNGLRDCNFCGFATDLQHCMFCSNIQNGQYLIFNKPVDVNIYERIQLELFERLHAELPNIIDIAPQTFDIKNRLNYNDRLDIIFNGLSEDFYGWIGTLPNYDEEIFINLFFRPYTLENL